MVLPIYSKRGRIYSVWLLGWMSFEFVNCEFVIFNHYFNGLWVAVQALTIQFVVFLQQALSFAHLQQSLSYQQAFYLLSHPAN